MSVLNCLRSRDLFLVKPVHDNTIPHKTSKMNQILRMNLYFATNEGHKCDKQSLEITEFC